MERRSRVRTNVRAALALAQPPPLTVFLVSMVLHASGDDLIIPLSRIASGGDRDASHDREFAVTSVHRGERIGTVLLPVVDDVRPVMLPLTDHRAGGVACVAVGGIVAKEDGGKRVVAVEFVSRGLDGETSLARSRVSLAPYPDVMGVTLHRMPDIDGDGGLELCVVSKRAASDGTKVWAISSATADVLWGCEDPVGSGRVAAVGVAGDLTGRPDEAAVVVFRRDGRWSDRDRAEVGL